MFDEASLSKAAARGTDLAVGRKPWQFGVVIESCDLRGIRE